MLTKSKTHSDTNPVCQRHCIATLSCFILPGLPSPSASQTPPQRERLWQSAKSAITARGSLWISWREDVGEVSCSMKLIWFCWKTSRNAKASPTRGGGIERSEDVGEVVQSSTCVLPLTRKASFVQPLRRLRRQLPQSGSPWQRGFVFDETDLRLPENVTECQSLPCQERWHRAKRRGRRGFVPTKTNPPHRASPVRGCGNGIRECLQALLSQKTTMRVLPP